MQERPARPLDMIDRLYLAFGRCCAGCDFWQQEPERTRPMGRCLKRETGAMVLFDAEGPGSVTRHATFELTEAKHVCRDFQDTFDWTALGVENPKWI